MFLLSSPLATHRGGLFSGLCTHTHHREVRNLKSFDTALDVYLRGLYFPLYGCTTGQVEIFYSHGGGAVGRRGTCLKLDSSDLLNFISKHLLNTGGLHQHLWSGTALFLFPRLISLCLSVAGRFTVNSVSKLNISRFVFSTDLPLITSCVTLGKSPHLSETPCSHL